MFLIVSKHIITDTPYWILANRFVIYHHEITQLVLNSFESNQMRALKYYKTPNTHQLWTRPGKTKYITNRICDIRLQKFSFSLNQRYCILYMIRHFELWKTKKFETYDTENPIHPQKTHSFLQIGIENYSALIWIS